MLVNTKTLLRKAHQQKYAVGHFNVSNMELVQGVVQAAENLNSPVILATSEGAIKYAGLNFLYNLVVTASELSKVPIALHLDHGQDIEIIKQCLQIGYSSVMIDASHDDFETNVKKTKQIVSLAHPKGIGVEAELGTIRGKEDLIYQKGISYTDPEKTKEFIDKTGCDFLAVAIGTSHGAYKFKGKAKLNQELLKKIRQKIKIPLVLHGASGLPQGVVKLAEKNGAKLVGVKGIPDTQIKQAIKNGINKINTDTDLRLAFNAAVRQVIKTRPKEFDPRQILAPARQLIQKVVEHRIKIIGSTNKA